MIDIFYESEVMPQRNHLEMLLQRNGVKHSYREDSGLKFPHTQHVFLFIMLSFVVIQGVRVEAFQSIPYFVPNNMKRSTRLYTTGDSEDQISGVREDGRIPCFYKPNPSRRTWAPRIHIEDLTIGQELSGYVVQDLLNGKTGPKLFFECGVGSTDKNGEWRIVNGMMRLGRQKISVARKRAARLRQRAQVDLYVSRIQLDCERFEVCTDPEEVDRIQEKQSKFPVSSLDPNLEVKGEVVAVRSYGVLVDIGANRNGLLHIQKVADLFGRYIEKEKGLIKSGLERGARLRLKIESNEKKRLYLDFTDDVKREAEEERSRLGTKVADGSTTPSTSKPDENTKPKSEQLSPEILSEWAEFAEQSRVLTDAIMTDDGGQGDDDDEDDDDDYDDYDEDRDIEDALGLGSY